MDLTPSLPNAMSTPESGITATIVRERARLKNFIRRRVADPGEAEDILQDVFFEFVQAYRLPEPIEQVGVRRAQFQGTGRGKRHEREHAAVAQAIGGAAPSIAAAAAL